MKNFIKTKIILLTFSILFIYSCDSSNSENSGKVWCDNCMTWHDKETAQAEKKERPIWCVNCKKYHAPGEDE